jgi:hypothetical protein
LNNFSTQNNNVPRNIKTFFDYLKGNAPQNDLCKKIDDSVVKAIKHEEWRADYMTLSMKYHDIYNDAREEGLAEGRAEGESKLSALILLLQKDGRISEINKVASDEAYLAANFAPTV